MKPITCAFLACELADLLITLAGLALFPVWEANPGGLVRVMVCKVLVTLLVCVCFERLKIPWLAWVVVIIAGAPVVWNGLVIAAEILA